MLSKNYYIVGDFLIFGKIKNCLIQRTTEQNKEKNLQEIQKNPPKDCLGNIKIEWEYSKNCWWNQGNLD